MDEGGDVKSRGWEESDAKGYGREGAATAMDKAEATTGATLTLVPALEHTEIPHANDGAKVATTTTSTREGISVTLDPVAHIQLICDLVNSPIAQENHFYEEALLICEDGGDFVETLLSALANCPRIPDTVRDKLLQHKDQAIRLATLKTHGAKLAKGVRDELLLAEVRIVVAQPEHRYTQQVLRIVAGLKKQFEELDAETEV